MEISAYPSATKQRISSIDILRGFALLGIVLVNSLGFNASFFNFPGYYGSLPDAGQQSFYNIYISLTADKFIFLFSFLYGYGICMQYMKFHESNQSFGRFFSRRMLALAFFGIAHVVLLWAGDILVQYAITGMIVFALRKLPAMGQFLIGVFFYFLIGLYLAALVHFNIPDPMTSTCTDCLEQARTVYASGNYFEILWLRLQEYYHFRNNNLFYYMPKIIGVTLMGFAAYRIHLHEKIRKNKVVWGIILLAFAGIATLSYFKYDGIANPESPYALAITMIAYEFMNFFMSGTIVIFILLLTAFRIPEKILRPIGQTGRMSLTNYLMQSLILGFVFYNWGLGYFGMTDVTTVVFIALSVFAFQIIWSNIWFQFFSMGPLESVWRRWSYGKK